MKANAVGWDHPIIAINYMNLGTLEMFRKNWKASEDYAKKCIEIYKVSALLLVVVCCAVCRVNE